MKSFGFHLRANTAGVLCLILFVADVSWAQSSYFQELQPTVLETRLKQYSGSDTVREATLKKMFREAGCEEKDLSEEPVLDSAAPNVSCTLPGTGEGIIIVGAHFDHVAAGDGVVDNWSGASLLPSLFQSLSSRSRRHTFVFVGFTDEEKGLLGSRSYVESLGRKEIARIHGMVDIDTLGLGPTEVWVSNSDPILTKYMIDAAAELKLPIRGMNVDGYGDSDARSFKKRSVPTITLHSVTNRTLGILHTKRDTIAAIQPVDYYNSYRLIASYLALLDTTLPLP